MSTEHGARARYCLLHLIHAVRTSDGNHSSSVLSLFALCSFRSISNKGSRATLRASGEAGKTEISPSHLVLVLVWGWDRLRLQLFPSQSAGR